MRRGFYIIPILFLLVATLTHAADFNFLPSTGSGGLNQEFTVNLKIDSGEASINAAQAKISFDPNILQVKDVSKDGAIFNFWLQEPEYSNTDGTLEFIGGTPNGISGSSLQVLKIIFSGKSIGASNLGFSDAAITAADGSGTNILGNANGASFTVSSGGAVPTPPSAAPGAPPVTIATPIPAPVQITRKAVQSSGLPATPDVSIPLYPNPDKWYNLISSFTVSWDLPPDISDLATELNQNPNYTIPKNSEGLFDSKTYPALAEDGTYYFHLRFKNNVGWGSTAHYRIALDTQPPLSFKIKVKTGLSSDEPAPLLSFQTGDALSGIQSYIIDITGEESIVLTSEDLNQKVAEVESSEEVVVSQLKIVETGIGYLNVRSGPGTSNGLVGKVYPGEVYEYTDKSEDWYKIMISDPSNTSGQEEGWVTGTYVDVLSSSNDSLQSGDLAPPVSEYKLKPHKPGTYLVSVKAIDKADNSIEDKVELEILPIDTPEITFITKEVIRGSEDLLTIKGIAVENGSVIVVIKDKKDFLVAQNEAITDENGEWEFRFNQELRRGSYFITVTSKDSRDALSLPADPVEVKYKDKPIIVLGGWEITFRDLVILLIIVGLGGAGYYWRKVLLHIARAHGQTIIITRDIKNSFNQIRQSLKNYAVSAEKKGTSKETKKSEYKKIEESLDKVEKYVNKDIEKLE